MNKSELLKDLLEMTESLPYKDSGKLDVLNRKAKLYIEKIFGHESQYLGDLHQINYYPSFSPCDEEYKKERWSKGKQKMVNLVNVMIEDISLSPNIGKDSKEEPSRLTSFDAVKNICFHFNAVAQQLKIRHDNRPSFEVNDEYDVQDLFHAILRLFFSDIRVEEWTPSYAGSSSRMDFLLKNEEIVIEIKKSRKGLSARKLGEELIVDIAKYKAHLHCKTLICFVYDPETMLSNPIGIEKDLEDKDKDFQVNVFIFPKR